MHTHTHTRTHTHVHTHARTYVDTYACTHTYTRTHIHTYTHTHARTHTHIHTRTRTHVRTHVHTHAHTYTLTHPHAHTHTHTGTQAFVGQKYGYRPVPPKIDALEFEVIYRRLLDNGYDLRLLDTWFKKDENTLQAEYQFQRISSILPRFTDKVRTYDNCTDVSVCRV